eukprot:31579-Eustigmatos_ZCMA.PRE.1
MTSLGVRVAHTAGTMRGIPTYRIAQKESTAISLESPLAEDCISCRQVLAHLSLGRVRSPCIKAGAAQWDRAARRRLGKTI